MIRRVVGLYFSPIGATARMTETLAKELADLLNDCSPEQVNAECHDLLGIGEDGMELDDETVAVIGLPAYVGKIPLPAVNILNRIKPQGAFTLAAVSYGARSCGNALYELNHYAEDLGFKVVGAGAFAVRYTRRSRSAADNHVPSNTIDEKAINRFGTAAASKIRRLAGCEIEGLKIKPAPLEVAGRLPFHGVSRIAPGAAAVAQGVFNLISIRHRDSEWYL